VIVDEYTGGVMDASAAAAAVAAMGNADIALLAGHGLFVLGANLRQAHLRAVSFALRAQRAWHVAQLGGGPELRPAVHDVLAAAGFPGFWDAMARRELRADPSILG